jgi:hypothetical protein
MTNLSSGLMPLRTILSPPGCDGPGRITRGSILLSGPSTMSCLRDWSVTIAASGTRIASYSGEPGTRMRPNWPGVIRPFAFGKVARPRTVPLPSSTTLSTKFIAPWSVQSCSSTEARVDDRRPVAGRRQLALGHGPLVGQEVGLRHVED